MRAVVQNCIRRHRVALCRRHPLHSRARVGWPLCWLLAHNYDNQARLRELASRPHPPRVTIFHGSEDEVIPVFMGRQLASMFPRMITFHEVPGAGHNTILFDSRSQIFAAMGEQVRQ